MFSRWNTVDKGTPDAGDAARDAELANPGSTRPGPNLSRRAFVEIAVGSLAGATLVGVAAGPAAAAASAQPADGSRDSACTGQGIPSHPVETIEYDDLTSLHLAGRAG